MATIRFQAIFQDGVLKPVKPLDFPDGTIFELKVLEVETEEDREEDIRQWEQALDACAEEFAKLPPEVLEQFDKDINAGRTQWPSQK